MRCIIEKSKNNYSAYIEGVDGITATGRTMNEIKKNIVEAVNIFKEECVELGCDIPDELKNDQEISFSMDTQSFLEFYEGIFSKAGLERLTGINQKQLWHYAKGKTKPRKEQASKIENALHELGEQLISIQL